MIRNITWLWALLFVGLAACGDSEPPHLGPTSGADFTNLPIRALAPRWQERFLAGDEGFDQVFRATDGLGPLYIRASCAACHAADSKGPGAVTKMAAVTAEGLSWAAYNTAAAFAFGNTVRPYTAGPGRRAVLAPAHLKGLRLSVRIGPAVFGRGYIEAVDAAAIVAQEAAQAQRDDGIAGRVNWVLRVSERNPESEFHTAERGDLAVGRFGLKARLAHLDDFVADAYQNDMGITSPLRPLELPNPDGWQNAGIPDIDANTTNRVTDYVRLLAIPRRLPAAGAGAQIFAEVRCSVCHTPTLPTRADYPVPQLAGIDAPIYSDLLVHDMGQALADGVEEGMAGGRHWRTAPLLGLRHLGRYLHDGRATSLEAAIAHHAGPGSEANDSVARFSRLSPADRAALLRFVETL